MKKRGLSPVIATVLLISITIVIGLIVFLWFRGISDEAITKFDGTNVKLVCEEVTFDASYSGGFVYVSNTGNVPIYQMKMKITRQGSYETTVLEGDWPDTGLNQGGAVAVEIGDDSDIDNILLIPVLVGSTSEGKKQYTCEEQHGKEI